MRAFCYSLLGALLLLPSVVFAQTDGGLSLMHEPHSYVDVADAADDQDPYDFNISVGFFREWIYGNIQREVPMADGRGSRNWADIARHEHITNNLLIGLEFGLFRDLSLYANLPVVLSDDRSLGRVDGNDPASLLDDGQGTSTPLLGVPFDSPTRSGLDHLALGIAWSIMNQFRDPALPTWVLRIEGRFNLADPLTACARQGTSLACRNWTQSADQQAWQSTDTGTNPGMTRGTNGLQIETRASWRLRYVEPYAGLRFRIEWPDIAGASFLPAGNIRGIVNDKPPIHGEITGGMAIIPWENRADWQRFTLDFRVRATYISEGRDYSPLFDALGVSASPTLSQPNYEIPTGSVNGAPTGSGRQVAFFGLTDQQAHAELGGSIRMEMRAARYVRFNLGVGLYYITPYVITFTDACNPNVDDVPSNSPYRGNCSRGLYNPNFRDVIDTPGERFRVNEQVRLDLFLSVAGNF